MTLSNQRQGRGLALQQGAAPASSEAMKPRGQAASAPNSGQSGMTRPGWGQGKLAREWTGSPGFLAPKGLEETGGGAEGNPFERQTLGPEL